MCVGLWVVDLSLLTFVLVLFHTSAHNTQTTHSLHSRVSCTLTVMFARVLSQVARNTAGSGTLARSAISSAAVASSSAACSLARPPSALYSSAAHPPLCALSDEEMMLKDSIGRFAEDQIRPLVHKVLLGLCFVCCMHA
jgi:hypothetical protein